MQTQSSNAAQVGGLDKVRSLLYSSSMRVLIVGTDLRIVHYDLENGAPGERVDLLTYFSGFV